MTTPILIAAAAAAALAAAPMEAPHVQSVSLPLDAETTVNGVPVACTGIGQVRLDPKWKAYPVRVEFSDSKKDYLTEEAASVFTSAGRILFAVRCQAPWILMKLPAGSYRIEATIPGTAAKPRVEHFSPPASGQMRLVLEFPDL